MVFSLEDYHRSPPVSVHHSNKPPCKPLDKGSTAGRRGSRCTHSNKCLIQGHNYLNNKLWVVASARQGRGHYIMRCEAKLLSFLRSTAGVQGRKENCGELLQKPDRRRPLEALSAYVGDPPRSNDAGRQAMANPVDLDAIIHDVLKANGVGPAGGPM